MIPYIQGYHSVQSASLEIGNEIEPAREVIYISDDSESDHISDDDEIIPVNIENWIRNTQAKQASIQYFDAKSRTWTDHQKNLSDDLPTELRDAAGSALQDGDMADMTDFGDAGESDSMAGPVVIPARNHSQFRHLNELCADIMQMHGNGGPLQAQEQQMDVDYEFCWTGM